MVTGSKTFKMNLEFNITGANNILDFKICKLNIKPELLDNTSKFLRIIFKLNTSNNYFTRRENKSSCFRIMNMYNSSGITLYIIY